MKIILSSAPELTPTQQAMRQAFRFGESAIIARRQAKAASDTMSARMKEAVELGKSPEDMLKTLSAEAWEIRNQDNKSLDRQNFRQILARGNKINEKTGKNLFHWNGKNYRFSFRIQNGQVSADLPVEIVAPVEIIREKSAAELQAERAATLAAALSDAAPGDVMAQFLEWLDNSTDEQLSRVNRRAAALRKERKTATETETKTDTASA